MAQQRQMKNSLRTAALLVSGAVGLVALAALGALAWSFSVVVCGLFLVASVLAAVGLRSGDLVLRRSVLAYSLACAVGGVSLWSYGTCALRWRNAWALRTEWGTRVEADSLKSRLQSGMSPRQALTAMQLETGLVHDLASRFWHGMTRDVALEAMGASTTLLTPKNGAGQFSYYVWCSPLCSSLGCCDGAVLIRFRNGQLDRVSLYDTYAEIRIVHYEPGGCMWTRPWGSGPHDHVRFSPAKTLEAILASESVGETVI